MIDLTNVIKAVEGDKSVPFHFKMAKLAEEFGELNQAYLARELSPNASKTALGKDDLKLEVMEEAVDTMLTALDVALNCGYTVEQVQEMIDKKNAKWLAKQNKINT